MESPKPGRGTLAAARDCSRAARPAGDSACRDKSAPGAQARLDSAEARDARDRVAAADDAELHSAAGSHATREDPACAEDCLAGRGDPAGAVECAVGLRATA